MRRMLTVAGGTLLLAACGGSDGGSATVGVVTGSTPTATPTPTPSPTPTPMPTPTPTPASSYPRYVDLTGDQTFQTACASLVLGSGLPTPQPATPFGDSPTLGYAASTAAWSVNGDGVALTFAAGDAVTAPAGQTSYQRVVAGSTQALTINAPAVSGTTLTYTRSFALRADRTAGPTLYNCVFGVPALTTGIPSASVSYGNVSVTGTAYILDTAGAVRTYVLTGSTGTTSYNPTTLVTTVTLHLIGNLQTGTTMSATGTDFGTYSGTGSVDSKKIRFSGSLDSTNRVSQFSSFAGTFFGNSEIGSAFEVVAIDTTSGNRVAVVGALTASK